MIDQHGRQLSSGKSTGRGDRQGRIARVGCKRPDEVFAAALEMLVREKKLEAAGEIVHLPGRGVVMKDEEAESKKIIENAFASAGLKVPALKDVLAGLKVDRARAQKIVTLLLRDKVLVKISDDLVFHRDALARFAQAHGVGEGEVAEDRRGPLQGSDWSKPQVCHPAAGISRPRTRDPAGGRRESNSVTTRTGPRIFTDFTDCTDQCADEALLE